MKHAIFSAALLVAGAVALAQPVYKWTDDKGQVHYSETPPPQDATQVKVPTGGPASAPAAPAEAKSDAAPPAAGTPEARQKRCEFEKRQLKVFDGPVVLYKNEKGEEVKMDEAKKEASKKLVEDSIKKYCP